MIIPVPSREIISDMLDTIFKAYDIRGVHPDQLNAEHAERIGMGCAHFLCRHTDRPIVVGRDMRRSSPLLAERLIKGITAAGADVIDVGRVDTPFVSFAINHLNAAGGVMVTASHNPPQYNGFKVSGALAKPIGKATGLDEIKELALSASAADEAGSVATHDLWDAYRTHVRRLLDQDALKKRPIKVAIDASNGMAGTMVPLVFGDQSPRIEGLTIVEIHFDNESGTFAHEPNPLVPANLKDLQAAVRKHDADLGICFDGDADRCVVVDERGETIGCDLLTAWLAADFLKAAPGAAVVYDLRSSKAVEEDVKAAGGEPVRGRVGHVFMKQALREKNGIFGGELSGHFYFRDNYYADSGAIAMATVLSALARSGRSMSENIAPIARYAQSGEINFEVDDKDAAIAEVKQRYAMRGAIDELDGVTVDCFDSEGWWANIRKSNTEPLLRLNLEARNPELADAMLEELAPVLGHRVDH